MDLYLIRHTRPAIAAGICYGQLDVPLAVTHEEEFRAIVVRLPAVDTVWSSPLSRCRALARFISERNAVQTTVDPRLAELNFGDWEGTPWDCVDRAQSNRWSEDYWNTAPPGGETYRALYERVSAALGDIARKRAGSVAVVTHAGPIRVALGQCLKVEAREYSFIHLDYGGVALLRRNAGVWRLAYING